MESSLRGAGHGVVFRRLRRRARRDRAAVGHAPLGLGPICGCFFGVWQGTVAAKLMGYARAPTHESVDRAILASTSTAVPGALAAVAITRLGHIAQQSQLIVATLLIVAAPSALACWVGLRLHARRLWLERVGGGLEPGWRIVRAVPGCPTSTLLPIVRAPAGGTEARFLVAVQQPRAPFREAETLCPVALVLERAG
jgi:hypothetical protein